MITVGGRDEGWTRSAQSMIDLLQAHLGLDSVVLARKRSDTWVALLTAGTVEHRVPPGTELPWSDTVCARVEDGRAQPFTLDARSSEHLQEVAGGFPDGLGAVVSLPLRDTAGELIGTLCVTHHEPVGDRLLDSAALLRATTALLASLLSAELRLQQAERDGFVDTPTGRSDVLTGLSDRRAFERRLAAEEPWCRAFGASAAVLVVEVVDLPGINRREGPEHADAVLRSVAAALRSVAGPLDVAARTAGGSFALLLSGVGADRALAVRDALRQVLGTSGAPAALGNATRDRGGLGEAWRRAAEAVRAVPGDRPTSCEATGFDERARGADGLSAAEDPPTALPTPWRAPGPDTALGPSGATAEQTGRPDTSRAADELLLAELLELARRQLGATSAFLGRWDGDVRTTRAQTSGAPAVPDDEPLERTLCQRIVDGRLPQVMRDTAEHPAATELAVTAALPIGSYVGVPVRFSDGELHGTLCCLSAEPDTSLSETDGEFLTSVAEAMARVLVSERLATGERHRRIARFEQLLEGQGTTMVFQPIIRLVDDALVGCEALARFTLPPRRPTAQWFLDAEQAGLTAQLEMTTARAAVSQAQDFPGLLALNFSATTLCGPGFADLLEIADPSRLLIEISEHERIEDYEQVLQVLEPLRAAGLRVAVDDAGAGFASLRHVVLLQPEVLKIDMSLVRDIDTDPVRRALVAALMRFASQTGTTVLAEGVETDDERSALGEEGVDLLQGWNTGAPLSAAEYRRTWGNRPAHRGPSKRVRPLASAVSASGRPGR